MVVKIKKSLAIIAAVVLTLLFAVSTAVPAFAEESDTAQSNAQFEVVEPEYNGDANDYVTLPKAPEKEGYIFQGWSVDGSTKLYDAGETIANSDGHKIPIKPVYKATGAVHEDALIKCMHNFVLGLLMIAGGLALIKVGFDFIGGIISAFGILLTVATIFLLLLLVL